jgi:hypothetical protein
MDILQLIISKDKKLLETRDENRKLAADIALVKKIYIIFYVCLLTMEVALPKLTAILILF